MRMSQLEKAITALEDEIAALMRVKALLLQQRNATVKRSKGPKAVPDKGEKVSA